MLASQALISFDEAARFVREATSGDPVVGEDIAIQGSEEIEKILDRQIVSRGTITEFHWFRRLSSKLFLQQWPVLSEPGIQIYEDDTLAYGPATLLTKDVHYRVNSDEGSVTRLDGNTPIAWLSGFEAVKVIYAGGYTQAAVPADLKAIALQLFAAQWGETVSGAVRVQSVNDAFGSRTFFGPAELSSHQLLRLKRHRRLTFPGGTTYCRSTVA